MDKYFSVNKKVTSTGNDQEKAQSERIVIPTPKTEVGKTKLTIRYLKASYLLLPQNI